MLRFLSRRNRNHQNITNANSSDIKSHRIPTNKNLIQCRVILLDNSDISIELSVSGLLIGLLYRGGSSHANHQKESRSSWTKEYKKLEKLSCLSFTYNHWDFIYTFFRCLALHVLKIYFVLWSSYIKEQKRSEREIQWKIRNGKKNIEET
jgi:hypothetical protein